MFETLYVPTEPNVLFGELKSALVKNEASFREKVRRQEAPDRCLVANLALFQATKKLSSEKALPTKLGIAEVLGKTADGYNRCHYPLVIFIEDSGYFIDGDYTQFDPSYQGILAAPIEKLNDFYPNSYQALIDSHQLQDYLEKYQKKLAPLVETLEV